MPPTEGNVALLHAIDGLGPLGSGAHTVNERVDLESMRTAARRAAILIYRLTR